MSESLCHCTLYQKTQTTKIFHLQQITKFISGRLHFIYINTSVSFKRDTSDYFIKFFYIHFDPFPLKWKGLEGR